MVAQARFQVKSPFSADEENMLLSGSHRVHSRLSSIRMAFLSGYRLLVAKRRTHHLPDLKGKQEVRVSSRLIVLTKHGPAMPSESALPFLCLKSEAVTVCTS